MIDNPSVKDPFDGVYDTRGFKRSGTGTDYALLFATDKYELLPEDKEKKLSPWRNLEKPIKDAKALGTELEKYGFKVDIRENVKTRSDIRDILNEYDKKYEPGDQLLVYFAGHGYCSAEQKKIGYIAASASRRPENDLALNTYVSYSYIRDFLDGLSCARIMLVLDVCYGGTFDRDIGFDKDIDFDRDIALNMEENPTSRGNGTRGLQQRLDLKETLKAKTRWYLSSGGKEEVQDGFGLEHSPFAASLLALLRDEASKDKVLTIPEIERQLPSKLRTELVKIEKAWKEEHPLWEGKLTQTPASGPFGSSKKSDKAFVFIKQ